jgi:hypothetical protein
MLQKIVNRAVFFSICIKNPMFSPISESKKNFQALVRLEGKKQTSTG